MISKEKNKILIKRYDGLERATSQNLRNERIDARMLGRKNGEENDNFSQNLIRKSSLQRRVEWG